MTAIPSLEDKAFLTAISTAVENTFGMMFGEKPVRNPDAEHDLPSSSVAGIISFTGGFAWSMAIVLTQDVAPAMVKGFTGIDIPFDSPDMGDAVAELVNILAGEVVSQLDQRRIKAQMGLPMVARGCPLSLMAPKSTKAISLDYSSKHGRFWLSVVSPTHTQAARGS